jgi:hypothetical protein
LQLHCIASVARGFALSTQEEGKKTHMAIGILGLIVILIAIVSSVIPTDLLDLVSSTINPKTPRVPLFSAFSLLAVDFRFSDLEILVHTSNHN